MNKRSIAFQLGIYVSVAVVIVISLIVFINYKHSRKIIMAKIEEVAIHQSSLIINEISKSVVTNQEVTRNVANQALYYHSHGDLQFFLHEVVQNNQILSGLHVKLFQDVDTIVFSSFYGKDNVLVNRKNLTFCSVFKFPQLVESVIQQDQGVWSDPFYCPSDSSKLMISYFLPLLNQEGESVGVVAGDINLDFLNNVISDIKIGDNGFAVIASRQGYYLTHPDPGWIMKRHIFEVSSKQQSGERDYYQQLLNAGKSGSGFAYPQLLNFEKSWFYFSSIPYTNWRVVIVMPAKELFDELGVVFREIVIVSLIGFLAILAIIVLIFNKMLSPLVQIVRSIQRFSFGDRSRRRGEKNEIELLSDSLKELQFQYNTYVEEQNQVRKDKRKYEKDLKSAKEIQRTIIPQDYSFLDKHKEIDLHAILQPAESIGGDLYDFFFIDNDHLLFTMGDVSGKGIPAALFMAVATTMIKSKSTNLSARNIVDVVNKALSKENSNQHFLTLFLGILNVKTGILDYCNAAHNYPFLLRRNKEIIQLEQTHGLPIGVYSNKTYQSQSLVLAKGDILFLYTDGVTDCKNKYGEMYGLNRLSRLMEISKSMPPKSLIERMMSELIAFKGETKQADDISLMAIQFNGMYE
ncbi:SpoIIE family protein phosphatase [Sunxiuqinia sp. sy24]|uniref:SpoIIE family protein phosphatase n=1 Tax=Sunxiuqinia sp. sy24 TaxID=3461495 RepID=UPI004045DD75